jgi:hypothetical protein
MTARSYHTNLHICQVMLVARSTPAIGCALRAVFVPIPPDTERSSWWRRSIARRVEEALGLGWDIDGD